MNCGGVGLEWVARVIDSPTSRVIEPASWRGKPRATATPLLGLLLVAEHLDVFLHQRGISAAENISLLQILLLHIQEGLGVKVVRSLQEVEIHVIVLIHTVFTRCKLGESSFALDAECKATEQRLYLVCSLVLSGTFETITFYFINFLPVMNAAQVSSDRRLQSDHCWYLTLHSIQ